MKQMAFAVVLLISAASLNAQEFSSSVTMDNAPSSLTVNSDGSTDTCLDLGYQSVCVPMDLNGHLKFKSERESTPFKVPNRVDPFHREKSYPKFRWGVPIEDSYQTEEYQIYDSDAQEYEYWGGKSCIEALEESLRPQLCRELSSDPGTSRTEGYKIYTPAD